MTQKMMKGANAKQAFDLRYGQMLSEQHRSAAALDSDLKMVGAHGCYLPESGCPRD